jgi:hypothetical protein
MGNWTVKTAMVWLGSTDLHWVSDAGDGITRELVVMVMPNTMTLDAHILWQGETLVRKHLELSDRMVENLWLTDEYELDKTFIRVMDRGDRV